MTFQPDSYPMKGFLSINSEYDTGPYRIGTGVALLLIFPLTGLFHSIIESSQFSLCWFKTITGKPCIFCGLTRSMSCFIRGDFGQAFHYNPFFGIAVVLILLSSAVLIADGIHAPGLTTRLYSLFYPYTWIMIVVAAVLSIIRMFL